MWDQKQRTQILMLSVRNFNITGEFLCKLTDLVIPNHRLLNLLFLFRSAIRNLAPALTDPVVRGRAELWINKLFGAEYHVETLREKRNRYLAALTVNMINDELTGVFADDPPMGTLPDLMKMKVLNARISEWENDTTWPDYLSTLPDNFKKVI